MIAGTLAKATSSPLNSPSTAPIAVARSTATTAGMPGLDESTSPVTNADTPTIDPTDRSTWRAMMTTASPAASSAVIATLISIRLNNRPSR